MGRYIQSSVEVLVRGFSVEDGNLSVFPVDCPGKGIADKMPLDDTGEPVCIYKNETCPFFKSVFFDTQQFAKTLVCTVKDNNAS